MLHLVVRRADALSPGIMLYELARPDGSDLPAFTAGAHIDVVVAPEFLRQFSLCGDPADRSCYQIAVLREDKGRGGSALMHRIFRTGRRILAWHPINHFPLAADGSHHVLMGGGIGVTPMTAMAHELHRRSASFELRYSTKTRADAGFVQALTEVPWAGSVGLHISTEGSRADLGALLRYRDGAHVYACGPDAYMQSVMAAAEAGGYPPDRRHLEYFSVPVQPERVNHGFTLELARSGRRVVVGAEVSAADALRAAGVHVDLKCSDGLCGVCECDLLSGEVEHRDFVLSAKQRATQMILCQSRAAEPDGILELDLRPRRREQIRAGPFETPRRNHPRAAARPPDRRLWRTR